MRTRFFESFFVAVKRDFMEFELEPEQLSKLTLNYLWFS